MHRILFLGGGKVGTALSRYFAESGFHVALYLEGTEGPEHLRLLESRGSPGEIHLYRQEQVPTPPVWKKQGPEIVFVCTPEGVYPEMAARLESWGVARDALCVTVSGIVELERFGGLLGDRPCARMHPAFSFPDVFVEPEALSRCTFLVEGGTRERSILRRLLQEASLSFVAVDRVDSTAYHAACVTASNLLAGLGVLASDLMSLSGLQQAESEALIDSLMSSVVNNGRANGFRKALSGPATRGDLETLTREAIAVRRNFPDAAELFVSGNRYLALLAGRNELALALEVLEPPKRSG